ncbi:MAG TPA: glycerol-3-phosphate 1-O-acyltransferase PlsY [Gemmataceae bacterium]|nr:glycerol-3-phosphate 1-O-acyltransferase PlsY [Gemmataceae bacterium]
MAYLLLLLTLAAGCLIGGVPFGWLIARWRGVDILRHGSGNIGATNVGRVLGRPFGLLVFVLDFAKGALPVLAASFLPEQGMPRDSLPVAAGVAAFLGHLFPIYLRFRGGKGVATGVGVVTVLAPWLALAVLAAWAVMLAASGYVSAASLTAAVVLSALRLTLTPHPWSPETIVVTTFCLFGTVLVFLRHAGNIRRLLHGSENRLQDSPAMLHFSKIVHVLALGLWFGTVAFFTVAGLVLFLTFDAISSQPAADRPAWFPLPPLYDRQRPSDKFPDPLRKEQGSRAAGAAVGPLFPWYYGIQAGCGVFAVITALGWWFWRRGSRVHAVRTVLLAAALVGVGLGWWMEGVVAGLREPRDRLTDEVLKEAPPKAEDVQKAEEARSAFLQWHSYSLLDSCVVVLLVAVAMALAAQMPAPAASPAPADLERTELERRPGGIIASS